MSYGPNLPDLFRRAAKGLALIAAGIFAEGCLE
jgi:hypothetical protein